MDLFTLQKESPFDPIDSIDGYKSLIWTERFSKAGDFELVTPNVEETLAQIPNGTILSILESRYLMMANKNKIVKGDDGSYLLTVSGDSLETYLSNRPARAPGQNSDTDWTFDGVYPISTAINIFTQIANTGTLNANDAIAGGLLKMVTSIVESGATTSIIVKARDLYSAVTEITGGIKCGIHPHKELVSGSPELHLEIYRGIDRTVNQLAVPPVIFHISKGDIVDASYLFTNKDFYNVAYVYSPKGSRVVYAPGVDPSISSWDRRVLYVDANDISADTTTLIANAAMDERGKKELSAHNMQLLFDGKINPVSTSYKTPDDYYLGDNVTLVAEYGVKQTMQVEEIIRISDSEGERTYPTLITL